MSVCFFVPAANDGASTSAGVAAEGEPDSNVSLKLEEHGSEDLQPQLQNFWSNVTEDVKKVTPDHFKNQVLPLARIKKIMKLDEEVKMISAEAPVLFAKAAEIFIHELTLRAWAHTEDNKRRTLQRNDIAMAISKSDQFDFLIDIVPRHEIKTTTTTTKRDDPPPRSHQATEQNTSSTTSAPTATSSGVVQQPVTIVQQIVTPSGEIQQMPIQLTQSQLNMIRLQMQNNPNQPILIQAPQQSPQIIQVASQAQQPQQQVYLAQVQTTQDDS